MSFTMLNLVKESLQTILRRDSSMSPGLLSPSDKHDKTFESRLFSQTLVFPDFLKKYELSSMST